MKFPKSLEKVLTDQDKQEIKAEFDKQVQIAVESALHQYDDEAIKRIEAVINQINESHKVKLISLIEKRKAKEKAICESIKEQYEQALTKEADRFKSSLARNIEKFIESKISNIVDYSIIKEAAKNNTAKIVLEGVRKQLGVDSALMKESIAGPILEGQKRLEQYRNYIKKLKVENERLNESLVNSESNLLIESKVSKLPEDTANYMRRMLKGKDIRFINEQFGYILDLYQDGKTKKRSLLKEEALRSPKRQSRVSEPKRKRDLIPEANNHYKTDDDLLMEEILEEMNDEF